jgi:tetratricopeptide (TPR) repeat protein
MPRFKSIYKLTILPLFSLTLLLEGCSVFSTIGDAVGGTYENTVSYFNLYYNARRAFRDAENEILAAAKAARGKDLPANQNSALPGNAQKNLDLVIDKCSNILAYHGKSSLVDDALMMIGKAYFYKADFAKSERKFSELISQYPSSSMALEAKLWYAWAQQKLGRRDDARKSAESLVASEEEKGDQDVLSQAYSLLASLNADNDAIGSAIELYEKAATVAEDDELKAAALSKAAELYFAGSQYQKSVDASLKVEEYTSDPYLLCQNRLLASKAYRNLTMYDKALGLNDALTKDFRFNEYAGLVLYERANVFLASGRTTEAVDAFRKLDTLYVRTDLGAKASFQLGEYYEKSAGDYGKAREFYTHAAAVPGSSLSVQANKKVAAFNSYFILKHNLSVSDSLMALIQRSDSLSPRLEQTEKVVSDTTSKKDSTARAPSLPQFTVNKDSLNVLEARAAASLGELFYADLSNPDSAFFWLEFAIQKEYGETSSPRILYILAQLASTYPEKTLVTADRFRTQLFKDFPNSIFAKQLQSPADTVLVEKTARDPAEEQYAVVEGLIEAGKTEDALTHLRQITKKYPSSPVSAKSQYAIGWLFENRFAKPESAIVQYKALLAQYPSSGYARIVSTRMLDTLSASPARADSVSGGVAPQTQKRDSVQARSPQANTKQNTAKPGAPLSRRAKVLQSEALKKTEKD